VTLQLWTAVRSLPGSSRAARRAEAEGWDGITFTDSQCLSGDPYVAMTAASVATERILLSVGVTNPWTRAPSVTASAIACVNAECGGRAQLGVGRGDSAPALIGLPPASLERFGRYLRQVRAYLDGDGVPVSDLLAPGRAWGEQRAAPGTPRVSRLEWVDDLPPVPVWAVASGPKAIALAATILGRVTLAVGADPARVRWAVELARQARPDVTLSAYVNVVIDDNRERGRALTAGAVAGFARFSALHGRLAGPAGPAERATYEQLPASYDIGQHFRAGAHTASLTAGFIDAYAIVGDSEDCRRRLLELNELGIEAFHIVGAGRDVDRSAARGAHDRFVDEVLRPLRGRRERDQGEPA
jgi:5,10-methylenetetrahydromethanopterin reductase